MSPLAQFRGLLRQSKSTVIDKHTKLLLVGELKTRIRKDQLKLRDEAVDLLKRSSQMDITVIQPILRRFYLQGKYQSQKHIRYFLKSKITTWPHENVLTLLTNYSQSLEAKAKSSKKREGIQLPLRPERQIPLVSDILGISQDVKLIEPLPIKGKLFIQKDQELNNVLQKVLKLYTFINSNSFLHSRNLQNPILTLPVTVLGENIADCRKKNLIKKRIKYIRNILTTVPPLETKDSEYLDALLDSFYQPYKAAKLDHRIRREYKKFMRKTYTIDQDFNFKINKNAYIKAKPVERDDYF